MKVRFTKRNMIGKTTQERQEQRPHAEHGDDKDLQQLFSEQADIELAILIGSQANQTANINSDWDIAIRWQKHIEPMQSLGKTETLRRLIAKQLNQPETKIDLIDLTSATLVLHAVVAEEGVVLKGENTLAWKHYLQRTWRDLKTYYWKKIMRLDLYQAETTRLATEQTALLNEVQALLASDKGLSKLEQNGVLHTLQILVENSIGKAKHILKAIDEPVPISTYDTFDTLARRGKISQQNLEQWNSVIGLRNRIVHEYMNIDMKLIYQLIKQQQYLFIHEFLTEKINVS